MERLTKNLKLTTLIVLTCIIYLAIFCWINRELFLRPYDYAYFGRLYSDSQYVKGGASAGGIGDDGLYAFAGYYYITGGDISRVSFESPPLAKYLIGVSILLFHNERFINLIYASVFLLLVYLMSIEMTNNILVAAMSTFLVGIDQLFANQILLSMLDLPMTLFFLGGLYWYIRGSKGFQPSINLFLAAVFFSLSFAMRFFPILPILLGVLVLGLLKREKKRAYYFITLLLIFVPVIYILTHITYIREHSFIDFLHYQYWIIRWRMHEPYVPANALTLILTGRLRSWWQKDAWLYGSDWTIMIPLFFIFSAVGLWRWRKLYPHKIIVLMTLVYFLYINILTVGVAKFLLPIYPIIVIAAVTTIMGFLLNVAYFIVKEPKTKRLPRR